MSSSGYMKDTTNDYPICWAVEISGGDSSYNVMLYFSQLQDQKYKGFPLPSLPNPKQEPVTQWKRAPDLDSYEYYQTSGALSTMNLLGRMIVNETL